MISNKHYKIVEYTLQEIELTSQDIDYTSQVTFYTPKCSLKDISKTFDKK